MTARPSPSGLHDRQSLASPEPPPAKHVSPTRAGHSLEEAVLTLSRDTLRLIGSFRHAGLLSDCSGTCRCVLSLANCTEARNAPSTEETSVRTESGVRLSRSTPVLTLGSPLLGPP